MSRNLDGRAGEVQKTLSKEMANTIKKNSNLTDEKISEALGIDTKTFGKIRNGRVMSLDALQSASREAWKMGWLPKEDAGLIDENGVVGAAKSFKDGKFSGLSNSTYTIFMGVPGIALSNTVGELKRESRNFYSAIRQLQAAISKVRNIPTPNGFKIIQGQVDEDWVGGEIAFDSILQQLAEISQSLEACAYLSHSKFRDLL